MNLAHVHLALNHFPVIGIVFSFLLLATSMVKRSEELQKVSLGAFLTTALLTVPVYFTGEPAEEIVEHLPGVSKPFIEQHEEAALISLIVIEILGVMSIGGLLFFRRLGLIPHWFIAASLVLSIVSMGLMVWTANLGGQIHHPETRADFTSPSTNEVKTDVREGSETEK